MDIELENVVDLYLIAVNLISADAVTCNWYQAPWPKQLILKFDNLLFKGEHLISLFVVTEPRYVDLAAAINRLDAIKLRGQQFGLR